MVCDNALYIIIASGGGKLRLDTELTEYKGIIATTNR
jgi:hypothetical protein